MNRKRRDGRNHGFTLQRVSPARKTDNTNILRAFILFVTVVGLFAGCSESREVSNTGTNTPEPTIQPFELEQGKSDIGGLETFRDAETSFTIMFPKDWERVPSGSPGTRASFVSRQPDGSMKAGFNVRVDHDPSLGDLPPKEHAEHLKRFVENGEEDIRSSIDAPVKVLNAGEAKFAGQQGYYTLYEIRAGGPGMTLRFLQLAAYRAGRTYAITFSCDADNYDSLLPVFKQIASTFTILPSPDQPAR